MALNRLLKGHLICHGIPERSFHIKGHQFPVCARCTGLYLGAFSTIILTILLNPSYNPLIFILGIIMVLPTFIDGLTQYFCLRESNNTLRFFSGLIGGIGLGIVITNLRFVLGIN